MKIASMSHQAIVRFMLCANNLFITAQFTILLILLVHDIAGNGDGGYLIQDLLKRPGGRVGHWNRKALGGLTISTSASPTTLKLCPVLPVCFFRWAFWRIEISLPDACIDLFPPLLAFTRFLSPSFGDRLCQTLVIGRDECGLVCGRWWIGVPGHLEAVAIKCRGIKVCTTVMKELRQGLLDG
jgi:hypothetical protein